MTERQNIKLMLLDGQETFSMACKEKLQERGYRNIEITSDPVLAIKNIEKGNVNAVIFDLVLSDMDGIEFMKRALDINNGMKTKYITCSAVSSESAISRMMSLGVDYYLLKPVSADIFAERVDMLFYDDFGCKEEKLLFGETAESKLRKTVTSVIYKIGIPANVKGYHYLRAAIMMVVQNPDAMNSVTKVIYPKIAEFFGTTPSRVERAIRHVIEVTWSKGCLETLDKVFGCIIDKNRGKPTNSEFIATVSDFIRFENPEFEIL